MLIPMRQQPQICTQASTQHPDLVDSLIFDEPTSVKAKQRSGQECSVCWIRSWNLAVVCFWAHCSSATRLWTNCWITNLAASQKDWQKNKSNKVVKKEIGQKNDCSNPNLRMAHQLDECCEDRDSCKGQHDLGGWNCRNFPPMTPVWMSWVVPQPSPQTLEKNHVDRSCASDLPLHEVLSIWPNNKKKRTFPPNKNSFVFHI